MARRRFVLVLVAVAVLAVALVSIVRTIRASFHLDFAVSWIESGIRVDSVPEGSSAWTAGLAAGDTIVRIDGRPVATFSDPVTALATGHRRDLTVRHPDGTIVARTLVPPPPEIDLVYLSRSLVSLLGLAIAIVTAFRTSRREAPTFVLLAAAALILAAVPHRTAAAGAWLGFLHRFAGASLPYLLLRFFWIFPDQRRFPRSIDALGTGLALFSGLTALHPAGATVWPRLAAVLRGLFVLSLAAGAVIQTHRWRRSIRDAALRRQIEWASLGMVVGLAPYAGLVLLPRLLSIEVPAYSWLAVLPIVAIPLGFRAALEEYRLWDLEPITRDALTGASMLVIAGLTFAAVNRVLHVYERELASLRNLVAFATGVLLVALLLPIRRRVERFLNRWLYHGRPAPRWLLTHSSRDLARTTDAEEILHRLVTTLEDGLEVEAITAYLRDGGAGFQLVETDVEEAPLELPPSVLGVPFPAPEEAPLAEAGHERRVPLERGGMVHGLLYLGRRRGIFPLGREGREVVETFAAQAALGLESARLLHDLRRQADEYRVLHANTQRIIESSAAGILVCDARGTVLSANARAAELLEAPARELSGLPLGSLVSLPGEWRELLPVRAAGIETVTTATATPRHVLLTVSVLELESGQFNGRVAVLQDVTELHDLQERLREQERLAALGRLASGLAHEINTPLTGIASYAQLLAAATPGDDPRAEMIRKLERQAFRVSRMVGNLLALARGGSEGAAPVDVTAAADRAAREMLETLETDVRLEVELPGGPVTVLARPGAVELAVGNLVRNAVEASPPGGTVRLRVTEEDGSAVVVVEDRGPGIPESIRERVFEPFFTTRSERGGTGLGLAITRDIIEQLGGEITLEPGREVGTRVRLTIPSWNGQPPSSSSTTNPSSTTF